MKLIVNSDQSLQNAIGELLDYNEETGALTWKVARGRCSAGEVAGYGTGRGYLGVRVMGKCYYAHRIIFLLKTGRFPEFVDHINGDRSDNRWSNLREVDKTTNGMNMRRPAHNSSGVIGVFWNSGKGKWTARIKLRQQSKHLGHFDDFAEAVAARKQAEADLGFHPNHGRH